jgi:hypothetical protein
MRTFLAMAVVVALVTAAGAAGPLVGTGKTKEGTFRGYEKGRFLFASSKGKPMKEQAGRVMKLILGEPLKVTYQTADAAKPLEAQFKGYDKKTFTFAGKEGKETSVPQLKMKTIELSFDMEGEEGGDRGGGRYPIPDVNLESLAGTEATPAQQAAIDKFTAAKKRYDEFVNVSSGLVQEMDKATGVKREEFLNQLRARKNDEQPLRTALINAYKTMGDAFPDE